jgi:hypothetical protein
MDRLSSSEWSVEARRTSHAAQHEWTPGGTMHVVHEGHDAAASATTASANADAAAAAQAPRPNDASPQVGLRQQQRIRLLPHSPLLRV